jgi:CheY-like chemotaxis protein
MTTTPVAGTDRSTIGRVSSRLREFSGRAEPATSAPEPSRVHRKPRSRHVLIVEDNDAIAALMAARLVQAGHTVDRASHAFEGWRLAQSNPPDAVLCDIELPGPSGWMLIDLFRSDPTLSEVGVMVMSSGGDAWSRANAEGCNYGFLDKTVPLDAATAALAWLAA